MQIEESQKKPILLIARTVIGKGSPHKEGTSKAHGSPLGPEEVALTKKALGLPEEAFYIPQSVSTFFATKVAKDAQREEEWTEMLKKWQKAKPDLYKEFEAMKDKHLPADLEQKLHATPMKNPLAGRSASQVVLDTLGSILPQIYGGSADLSCSDLTMMKHFPVITPRNFAGKNIKYGVREFAMAAAATGLAQTGMITPFVGTFFTFSDYMRNAIRLAALSKIQVVYQFTHDSIFLGEDGPTHQSVEQLASLRAMPNLHVIRPADNFEVKMAWLAALHYEGPTAIVLSRQNLPELSCTDVPYKEGMGRGAYIVRKENGVADFTLFATGSEVSLALDVANALERIGKKVRVVSMPCWEIFEKQDIEYRLSVVGGNIGRRVSLEAGVSFGWHKWTGPEGINISIERFGESAPQSDLAAEFGFTVDAILERLLA